VEMGCLAAQVGEFYAIILAYLNFVMGNKELLYLSFLNFHARFNHKIA